MIDFIRADFYRLIHSKGFWITEFALFCVISLGTLYVKESGKSYF